MKWGLRLPSKIAHSEENLRYQSQVESLVHDYVVQRLKSNLLKPMEELNLGVSVRDVEIMATASEDIVQAGEKGDLKQIHQQVENLTE